MTDELSHVSKLGQVFFFAMQVVLQVRVREGLRVCRTAVRLPSSLVALVKPLLVLQVLGSGAAVCGFEAVLWGRLFFRAHGGAVHSFTLHGQSSRPTGGPKAWGGRSGRLIDLSTIQYQSTNEYCCSMTSIEEWVG